MRILSEASQDVLTEYGGYCLRYELLEYSSLGEEDPKIFYGLRIWQVEKETRRLYDFCLVPGVTEELTQARAFFQMAVKGRVMPVSLPDMIDDLHTLAGYTDYYPA